MGNNLSSGKNYEKARQYGEIIIQTEKTDFFPGEAIKGNVYLNLLKPYQGNKLTLKFKGREFTHWVDSVSRTRRRADGSSETYHEDVHRKQEAKTHDTEVTMYSWQGMQILPGQFTFPFNMILPPKLAGTFFQKRHRLLADISYHLEAVLTPINKSHPKLKFKHKINIYEAPTMIAQTQDFIKPTLLTSCCCCNKGQSILHSSFQKNVYIPGEIANVQIELDNRGSEADCSRITLSLRQKLKLRAFSHTTQKEFIIVSLDIEGVKAKQQGQSRIVNLNLPPSEQNSLWIINSQGGSEKIILQQNEGSNTINPTSHGTLIESEFFLNVTATMNGCCTTSPRITIPIDINAPILQPIIYQAPVGWNPQVMDVYNMSYGISNANLNMNLNQNSIGNNMIVAENYPQQTNYSQQNNGFNNQNNGFNSQNNGFNNQNNGFNNQNNQFNNQNNEFNNQNNGFNNQNTGFNNQNTGLNNQNNGFNNQNTGFNNQNYSGPDYIKM